MCIRDRANAAIRPALPWNGPVIFGWNSWAALMGKVSFEKYKEACDFMKSIKDTYQGSDGKQYVNYDAAWGRFTNKMRDSVAYAEANGQEPGTYYSPFITHEPVSYTHLQRVWKSGMRITRTAGTY